MSDERKISADLFGKPFIHAKALSDHTEEERKELQEKWLGIIEINFEKQDE